MQRDVSLGTASSAIADLSLQLARAKAAFKILLWEDVLKLFLAPKHPSLPMCLTDAALPLNARNACMWEVTLKSSGKWGFLCKVLASALEVPLLLNNLYVKDSRKSIHSHPSIFLPFISREKCYIVIKMT